MKFLKWYKENDKNDAFTIHNNKIGVAREAWGYKQKEIDDIKKEFDCIFKYYTDTYQNTDWDVCCNGAECGCKGEPCDPEYYIYESLKKINYIFKE